MAKNSTRPSSSFYKSKGLTRAQKTQVKKLIDQSDEKMLFQENSVTSQNVSNGGLMQAVCCGISQGDLISNRNGNKVRLDHLSLNYNVEQADSPFNIVRVILFQWYGDDATDQPSMADILQDVSTGHLACLSPYQQKVQSKMFHILHDRVFVLNNQGGGTSKLGPVVKTYLKKGLKKEIQFNATNTTGINKIYMLAVSDSAASAHPQIYWSGTAVYYDS